MLPKLPASHLPRLGLLERFDAVLWAPTRLLLLVAGTGYGKTTLIADACARSGAAVAWLMLDPEDQSLRDFLGGLWQAIRRAVPDLRTSAMQLLARDSEPAATAMQAIHVLLEDLEEQLEGPLYLVLDDYHVVNIPAINRVVSRIVKYLPSAVRLILISRTMPDLEVGHLRAKSELVTWSERDLLLSVDEVDDLLCDLPRELSHSLHQRTQGWIAALLLYRSALRTHAAEHADSHWVGFLEAYFEQEVLAPQGGDIQEFLLRASLLDTIEPALCESVLGLPAAARAIAHLKQNHVFVLNGEESTLRLHPLFRDFLQARLRRNSTPEELSNWAQALGQAYWQAGRYLAALDFWLEGNHLESAVSAVESLAGEWSAPQRVSLLEAALAKLPEAAIPPSLALIYGDVLRQWGELDRAMPLLERARSAFSRSQDAPREGRALTLLAACWGMQGQLKAMQDTIESALQLVTAGDPATRSLARIVQGNCVVMTGGSIDEAIEHFEESLRLARQTGDRYSEARALHNMGVAHTKLGNFVQAMACYEEGLAFSQLTGGIPHFWMTSINRCLLLLYLGRAEEALSHAEAIVIRTRELRYAREECEALAVYSQACVQLGRFEEAARALEMAEAMAARNHFTPQRVTVFHVRSYLAFAQGRHEEALSLEDRALLEAGVIELDARHLEFAQLRSRLLLALERHDEAMGLIGAMLGWLESLPFRFHRVEAWLTAAEAHAARGEESRALELRTRAQALASEQGYDMDVLRLRRTPRRQAFPLVADNGLRLRLFGGLHAVCNGRPVGARQWQSAKAKWLLAYLLEHPQGATKAFLLEALFDDVATDASVTMTVTRLRKALEPELPAKAPSAYVLFQGGQYVFNALAPFWTDTLDFIRHLEAARGPDEVAHLTEALALYAGDFLPEFSDPWVEGRRQNYRDKALEAVKRLMRLYTALGDASAMVETAHRGLTIDPCDEGLHASLIQHHLEHNQVHRARDQYHLCVEALAKSVGIKPGQVIQSMVADLRFG